MPEEVSLKIGADEFTVGITEIPAMDVNIHPDLGGNEFTVSITEIPVMDVNIHPD